MLHAVRSVVVRLQTTYPAPGSEKASDVGEGVNTEPSSDTQSASQTSASQTSASQTSASQTSEKGSPGRASRSAYPRGRAGTRRTVSATSIASDSDSDDRSTARSVRSTHSAKSASTVRSTSPLTRALLRQTSVASTDSNSVSRPSPLSRRCKPQAPAARRTRARSKFEVSCPGFGSVHIFCVLSR